MISSSPSTASLSAISFTGLSMRGASSKISVATEEEEKSTGEGSLLKGGELLLQKGAKTNPSKTISRLSQTEVLSSSSQDWKRVYATLSKDCRLILFDCDKEISGKGSISKKPVLTKVVASIDINSLEPHAIQLTDDSVSGRR